MKRCKQPQKGSEGTQEEKELEVGSGTATSSG